MHFALLDDSIDKFDKFSFLTNQQQPNISVRNQDGHSLNSHLRTVPILLILHIRSAHLQILGFPIGDAY